MIQDEVPSPIDLRDMDDAREWERTAMQRPFREEFFSAFDRELSSLQNSRLKVLELGSGPGFLAHFLVSRHPDFEYTLLDFSSAMHTLARRRLQELESDRLTFIVRSFKEQGWERGLGEFDVVITNQAVHELRHKNYAVPFFKRAKSLLAAGGVILVCDHYCGEDGMKNDQLFMSLDEQREALKSAGYTIEEILVKGGRALYRAT